MGIFDWIKQASISASAREKERAYWWVSEAQRKKCRKLLDDAWKNANALTLPWDRWHNCMQQEPKPLSEYKTVRDIRWLVNFIKELVGIPTVEEITVKEIPPTVFRPPPTAPRPAPKPEPKRREPSRKYITKFGKRIEKPIIIKPKKPIVRRLKDRSHLNFNLFSGALNWRNLKKPDFLLKFENIGDKILEKISMITGAKK